MASSAHVRDDVKLGTKEETRMFFESMMTPCFGKHRYTLAATGIPFRSMDFDSRQAAESAMYGMMDRRGLRALEVYDDKHDKTYVCANGIRFYITRW